jgi:hypothetical protein
LRLTSTDPRGALRDLAETFGTLPDLVLEEALRGEIGAANRRPS